MPSASSLLPVLVLMIAGATMFVLFVRSDGAEATPDATHGGQLLLYFPGNPESHAYLNISFLVASFPGDTPSEVEDAMDEAYNATLASYPGAEVIRAGHPGSSYDGGLGSVSAQFNFTTPSYYWPSESASWAYNDAGKPAGLDGELPVLQASANSWNSAGGTNWQFLYLGTTADSPNCSSNNGQFTVGWGPLPGSVLGQTCVWFSLAGDPKPAVEFDMVIDPDWNWTTGNPVGTDLFTIGAHEFGHALGLGHTGGPCPGTLMCATYNGGDSLPGPAADDIAGIASLYNGSGGQPTPTNTPSATSTPTNTPGPGTPTASPPPTFPGFPPTGTPPATNTPWPTPTPAGRAEPTPTPADTLIPALSRD